MMEIVAPFISAITSIKMNTKGSFQKIFGFFQIS